MYFLIFSLFFFFFYLWDWQVWLIPLKANSWKSLYFRKSFKECFFFFLEIQWNFSALIVWDYGQVVFHSGVWTEQKQALEGRVQNSWQGAHAKWASVYGVTAKLKPYPLLFAEWQPPDCTGLCPAFCISLRQYRCSGLLRTKLFLFTSIWFCSVRESELSSLLFLLKGLNWAEVKTGFVSHTWYIKVLIVIPWSSHSQAGGSQVYCLLIMNIDGFLFFKKNSRDFCFIVKYSFLKWACGFI